VGFVYILRCADGTLYTGAAKSVEARLREHLAGRASRYTRARQLPTWNAALREERRIKGLSRREKEALIASQPEVTK
jgi:putative endonuclease